MEVNSLPLSLLISNVQDKNLNAVPATQRRISLILYTTLYREGGEKFQKVAHTKYKQMLNKNVPVCISAVESKKEFLQAFTEIKKLGFVVDKFYFYGHSGMYGIMFGSREWPEQFSPYEWRNMNLPVDADSEFYFYACRSGRWFAPFISRTLNIKAHGFHNYTTVSLSPNRFVWEGYNLKQNQDLYIIACPGKKSHGLWASTLKYSGLLKADELLTYQPEVKTIDTTYDSVAHLYEETFEDINVRKDELNWLDEKLTTLKPQSVLDIGCGNGSFLNQLSKNFISGQGVDLSAGMIAQAKKFRKDNHKLSFTKIDGPQLPFADNSFDVVMSTLAFRYLDWDPCISEILRVLKPGGRFLVLDMVTAPVSLKEYPLFLWSKLKFSLQKIKNKKYYSALKTMVTNQNWQKMLSYNPIRSEHEMRWYLESRFAGQKAQILNIGWKSRIIAFDTGPVDTKKVAELSYP